MENKAGAQKKKELIRETMLILQKNRQSIELDEYDLITNFEQKIQEAPPQKDTSYHYYSRGRTYSSRNSS